MPSAQIIMISAFEQFSYAQRRHRARGNFYLVKPIKPRDINEKACQCVSVQDEHTRDVQSRRSMEVFSAYRESLLAGDSAQAGRFRAELKSTGENAESARFVYQQLLGAPSVGHAGTRLSADDMISDQSELLPQLYSGAPPARFTAGFPKCRDASLPCWAKAPDEFGRRVIREACAYIDSLPPGANLPRGGPAPRGLSPSYFSKLFKRDGGPFFYRLCQEVRIESASSCCAPRTGVYEICAELGYRAYSISQPCLRNRRHDPAGIPRKQREKAVVACGLIISIDKL